MSVVEGFVKGELDSKHSLDPAFLVTLHLPKTNAQVADDVIKKLRDANLSQFVHDALGCKIHLKYNITKVALVLGSYRYNPENANSPQSLPLDNGTHYELHAAEVAAFVKKSQEFLAQKKELTTLIDKWFEKGNEPPQKDASEEELKSMQLNLNKMKEAMLKGDPKFLEYLKKVKTTLSLDYLNAQADQVTVKDAESLEYIWKDDSAQKIAEQGSLRAENIDALVKKFDATLKTLFEYNMKGLQSFGLTLPPKPTGPAPSIPPPPPTATIPPTNRPITSTIKHFRGMAAHTLRENGELTEEAVQQQLKHADAGIELFNLLPVPTKQADVKMIMPPIQDAATIFTHFLKHSNGICIGEDHIDHFSKKILIDNMKTLKKLGVNTLFLENIDFPQEILDVFFTQANSKLPEELRQQLEAMDKFAHLQKPYSFIGLFEAAKQAGIRIVGLETELTNHTSALYHLGVLPRDKNDLNPERLSTFNYQAVQTIQKYQKEHAAGKYVVLAGSMHVTNNASEVLGIHTLLDLPSLIVIHEKQLEECRKLGMVSKNACDVVFVVAEENQAAN